MVILTRTTERVQLQVVRGFVLAVNSVHCTLQCKVYTSVQLQHDAVFFLKTVFVNTVGEGYVLIQGRT